jgi:plasmid segregation protein ParM
MIQHNDTLIIGLDHGYGNMKTANHCFPTGIIPGENASSFAQNILEYGCKSYLIGEGHKDFIPDKVKDDDFYHLSLAGIAEELDTFGLSEGSKIHIAAGLPLTWTGAQKDAFAAYLTKNTDVTFTYRKKQYTIKIAGVSIFPQGYAAVAPYITKLKGVQMLVDIGNGTMNVMYLIDGRPQLGRMYTETFGTHQCMVAARAAFSRKTQRTLNDAFIEEILRTGESELDEDDFAIVKASVEEYVEQIYRKLHEYGYDEKTIRLQIVGGGGCLLEHFGHLRQGWDFITKDICAAAKGYEYLAELKLTRQEQA